MKRMCVLLAGCLLAIGAGKVSAQCDNPYDNVLCVYPVPDAPTDIRGDGVPSAFWSDWAGKDYLEMIPPQDCYPGRCGFTGPDDATLVVKAAGNSKGLYILSEVTDNTWVDRADNDDWGADAIDFYFDALDANTIWTCTDCLIGLWDSKLSYTTQQFQVWMGATALPTGCRYAAYDDFLWSWTTGMKTWDMIEAELNIQVEVISQGPTKKIQEWFFPWQNYGKRNSIPPGTQLDGKRLAFSGGYNDKDGDNPDPDCLRWLGKDPWAGDANYWGDLLLLDGMGSVEGVNVKPQAQRAPVSRAVAGQASYYTLHGKKVNAEELQGVAARAVVVNRAAGAKTNVTVLGR